MLVDKRPVVRGTPWTISMGAVKGKPLLVEKNQQPLGFILRLEEELGKGKKYNDSFILRHRN